MQPMERDEAPMWRARFMLLAAAVPQALAKALASGKVNAAAVRDEWLARPGATASHGFHASLPVRVPYAIATQSFDEAERLPALQAALQPLWDALPIDGDIVVLVESPAPDAQLQDWTERLLAEAKVMALAFEGASMPPRVLHWPLRVGIAAGAEGETLRAALVNGHFRELYSLAAADADDVDLWVVPQSLAAAANASIPHCAAVLAIGGGGDNATLAAMEAIQWQSGAAAVAACPVSPGDGNAWFQELVSELAHDRPLPAALFAAANASERRPGDPTRAPVNLPPPAVCGDGAFLLAYSRISATTQLLGRALHRLPAGEARRPSQALQNLLGVDADTPIGQAFEQNAARFTFQYEKHDATAVVLVTRDIESRHGPLLPGGMLRGEPRMRESAPPPPSPAPAGAAPDEATAFGVEDLDGGGPPVEMAGDDVSDDELRDAIEAEAAAAPTVPRHVQGELFRGEANASNEALAADTDYRLRVHIGPKRADIRIVARDELNERSLPPSADGHRLTLVFFPLSRLADGDASPPPSQRAELLLPPAGASGTVDFALRSGAKPARYRARLVVTFANRVLQTLLVDVDAQGRLQMQQENVYQPTLAPDPHTLPAQIAFVINDDPDGRPALATLTVDSSSLIDGASLVAANEVIGRLLGEANRDAVGAAPPATDDEDAVTRLRALAMHGAALLGELQLVHSAAVLAAATHVQLVEAVKDAFFPIEFLYAGKAPMPTAALCPHAKDALGDPAVHAACPHAASKFHLCPAQFWGLSKCIERLAAQRVDTPAAPVSARLGPFQRVLMGASERARQEMDDQDGLPAHARGPLRAVVAASGWEDWCANVAASSPDLMILLPHTMVLADGSNMEALEISADPLPSSSVDPTLVRGTQAPGPLVLLLGCSTVLTKTPFLNFVRGFQRSGAPVVIGTLAKIHASQASDIAERFLDQVDAGAAPRRVDEVLRDFKCELFGEGNHGALALVSYGHASWEI